MQFSADIMLICQQEYVSCQTDVFHLKQGVALTGRNRTGPPCSVYRPTAHAPGGRPARPPQRYRRRQTTKTDASEQDDSSPLGGPVIITIERLKLWRRVTQNFAAAGKRTFHAELRNEEVEKREPKQKKKYKLKKV